MLRWINERLQLYLKFSDIEYTFFLDMETLEINVSLLIDHLLNNSRDHKADELALRDELDELLEADLDLWQVAQGHDLSALFAIGLMDVFGASHVRFQIQRGPNPNNRYQIPSKAIEGYLIPAYAPDYFRETQLYQSIKRWEADHPPFIILAF